MMSIETIRNQSRQAAQRAAAAHRRPLLVEKDDLITREILEAHLRRMPNLGDYTPAGYKEVDVRTIVPGYAYEQFFVDASGFGSPGEAAMSQNTFVDHVQLLGAGYLYAIGETGQFQLNVRLFLKG